METNPNQNPNPKESEDNVIDYEADMERICEKWKNENENNNYVFSATEMVNRRGNNVGGGGRQAYSPEGYEESKMKKVLKEKGFIKLTTGDKFILTEEGIEYCRTH